MAEQLDFKEPAGKRGFRFAVVPVGKLVADSKTPPITGPTSVLTPSTMLPATLVAASSCGVRARHAREVHSHGRDTHETRVTTPASASARPM
jgi:hypothetical protein